MYSPISISNLRIHLIFLYVGYILYISIQAVISTKKHLWIPAFLQMWCVLLPISKQ